MSPKIRPHSAGAAHVHRTSLHRGALLHRPSALESVQNTVNAWVQEGDRETAIRSGRTLSAKRNVTSATKGRAPFFVADVAVQNVQPVFTTWPGEKKSKSRPTSAVSCQSTKKVLQIVQKGETKVAQTKVMKNDDEQSEPEAPEAVVVERMKAKAAYSWLGSRVRQKFGKLWRPIAFSPGEQNVFQQQLRAVVGTAGRCADSLLSDTEGEYFRRPNGIDPQKLTDFLRELDQFARNLDIPTIPRTYRQQYTEERLCYFFYRVPCYEQLGSGSPSLPITGFAPQTLMLALSNFSWRFVYNGQRIKLCECTGGECQMSLDNRFTKCSYIDKVDREKVQKREYVPEEQRIDPRASVVLSMVNAVGAGRRSVCEHPERQRHGKEKHLNERHLPMQLLRAGKAVRTRFSAMLRQLKSKLEELPEVWQPTQGAPPPTEEEWDRYMISMTTCVQIFDHDYTKFERLYLELMDQMMSLAKAPLRGMAEHSKLLRNEPHGYYDPMQVAHLCQRLGLLNKNVNLGGKRLKDLDPKLLEKAKRAQEMDTFPVVRDMARQLICRFDELCQLLTDLDEHEENLQPELRECEDFREAVIALEETWDWCRHVLSQQALDFIGQLIETLEGLRASFRNLLYQAVAEGTNLEDEEQAAAEEALHSTLPIVIYIDELHRDVFGQPGRAGRDNGIFRSLFGCCPKTYHRLRSEIGKFDNRRFQTLFNFILHGADSGMDPKQFYYFENLHRQLKETAAFTDDSIFSKRSGDERERWLHLHGVVHQVAPHLFAFNSSSSAPESPVNAASP